jgi:hypothetical protein
MNPPDDLHHSLDDRAVVGAATDAAPRRVYQSPELVIYGSLLELTRVVGNDGFDGAIGSRQTS